MTGGINDSPRCPYVGLVPYSEEDAHFFFGRENEREIITANLFASRLTVLYGASGVGKSSVLRAGVVYHLRQRAKRNLDERGRPEFAVVYFNSWIDDPLIGLVNEVRKAVAQAMNCDPADLSPPGRQLDETLENLADRVAGHLLIILDQFEEYFQYHQQEGIGTGFARQFSKAVNRPDLRANFVVSTREDALAKLDRFKGAIPELFENRYQVRHLSREAARAAIERPIQEYNRLYARTGQEISVEPSLVEAVLEQVETTGPDILRETDRGTKETGSRSTSEETFIEAPYLQLVMTHLWNEEMRISSQSLRWETLERLGKARRIVETHLEAVMREFKWRQRGIAASVFRYLVTPEGTKNALSVKALAYYSKKPEWKLKPVLTRLTSDVRILRSVAPPLDSSAPQRFEIFHDVLARAVLDWRIQYVRKKARFYRRLQALLALLVVIGGLIGGGLWYWQDRKAFSRWLAGEARNQLDNHFDLSLLLSIEANRAADTLDARYSLIMAMQQHPSLSAFLHGQKEDVISVAFTQDGKTLASGSRDGTVILWDVATRQPLGEPLTSQGASVSSIAFSPDGKTLAVAMGDKPIKLWDAAKGEELATLTGHTAWITSIAFPPDGKTLASGSADGTVVLWNLASEEQIGLPVAGYRGDSVSKLAFSPDGKTLAVATGDKPIKLWDAAKGQEIATLTGHTAWITSMAFPPDGKTLASGSDDGTVILWDVADPRKPGLRLRLTGHKASVSSIVFSPHGNRLASSSRDQTIKLWDAKSGQELATLAGHSAAVSSVAFSPDHKTLASGSDDGTVILWDVTRHRASVLSVAFPPTAKPWPRAVRTAPSFSGMSPAKNGSVNPSPVTRVLFQALPSALTLTKKLWPQVVQTKPSFSGMSSGKNRSGSPSPVTRVLFQALPSALTEKLWPQAVRTALSSSGMSSAKNRSGSPSPVTRLLFQALPSALTEKLWPQAVRTALSFSGMPPTKNRPGSPLPATTPRF